jgi:hypothetical protein
MPFDHTVSRVVKTREGTMAGNSTPYMILSSLEDGTIYVQDGKFYDPGGLPIDDDDVPDWAWDNVKNTDNATRVSLGFEAKPENDKALVKRALRGPRVDFDAASKGNPPMQLNATGPSGEPADKASPVPQDDEDDEMPPAKATPAPAPAAKAPVKGK